MAYGWVHRAAWLLANDCAQPGERVRCTYEELLRDMGQQPSAAGALAPAIQHFLRVTASYWPGLFACYDIPSLPRTNNDLEHYFGSARYHQRRATGRKGAEPSLVLRGAVRVVAAVATSLHPFRAPELWPADLERWRRLRRELDELRTARRRQLRFRRDPAAYLSRLEGDLLKASLPP